jgi:hypothetical protein
MRKLFSFDVNYLVRAPCVSPRHLLPPLSTTAYGPAASTTRTCTLVNPAMSGVNERTPAWSSASRQASSTVGERGVHHRAVLIPTAPARITRDNGMRYWPTAVRVLGNGHIGGMPESAASAGLRYNNPTTEHRR